MNNTRKTVIYLMVVTLALYSLAFGGTKSDITRTFDKKEAVKIHTISGDCIVRKAEGDQIEVEVSGSYYPRDSFEPKFRERDNVLKLSEKMYGSNSGSSEWKISIPDGVRVSFSSASGSIEIEGCNGEFGVKTASGDIRLIDCEGEFDISTASGNIEADNCKGEFDLSTASGNVWVDGVVIGYESSFSTASGKVSVVLAETSRHNLQISSASGRATLNYGGNPVEGYFEFVAKDRHGRIVCPYEFDDEEQFRRWRDRYVRKSFTRENDSPQIIIETASGRAVLKES